jgi:multidrug efflux pump subunit AcrA (membrane-fusion protein)
MKSLKWLGQGVIGATMLAVLPLAGAENGAPPPDDVLIARTVPSHTAKPSFMEIGVVKEWFVKPDDVVKKGQVLGTEDVDLEKLALRSLTIQAKSTAAIEAATADRDARKVEYDNKQKAAAQDATAFSEVEEAKLNYQQKEAELRNAEMQHEKQLSDVDTQAGKIEKMKLLSPADGIVKEINIQEGEVVDPNKPDGALTLVTNNPLWVEVKVPSAQALKLKIGDTGLVAYQSDPDNWLKAKVIYLNPEVDAASDKETVRLELNNDQNKVSGLWVSVRFPGAGGTN